MADKSAALGAFGVSVEEVSALAPMVTIGQATTPDPVYDRTGPKISRDTVEGWITAVSARADLRLGDRSKLTDETRKSALTAAAHDAVVNGAASYLVAAAMPTRASINDPGSYDSILWSRFESALDSAAQSLDDWLDAGVGGGAVGGGEIGGSFPETSFPDGMRF